MDTLAPLLAVVTGIALRLAIPIAITVVAVYFLRRLDARWKTEAESQPAPPVVEKPRCWETNDCDPAQRKDCPGYQSDQPCWQAFRSDSGYLQERCLECKVFRQTPMPGTPIPANI